MQKCQGVAEAWEFCWEAQVFSFSELWRAMQAGTLPMEEKVWDALAQPSISEQCLREDSVQNCML